MREFINFVKETQATLSQYGSLEKAAEKEKCTVDLIKYWHRKIYGIEPYVMPANCKQIFKIFEKMAALSTSQVKNRLDLTYLIKENQIIWHKGRPYSRASMHLTPELMAEIAKKNPSKVEPNPYIETEAKIEAPVVVYKPVEKIFEGDVYIIGGGNSTEKDLIPMLSDKNVIGVNTAFMDFDVVDVVYFGDGSFYDKYHMQLAGCKLPKFTTADLVDPDIHNLRKLKGYGATGQKDSLVWNGNSGAAAINLAWHLGAERIILIGFDMKRVDGKTHYHNHYPKSEMKFALHLKCFKDIKEELPIKVINTSLNSEINVFEKQSLASVLGLKEDVIDLESMTIPELKEYAYNNKINITKRKKREIIKQIKDNG